MGRELREENATARAEGWEGQVRALPIGWTRWRWQLEPCALWRVWYALLCSPALSTRRAPSCGWSGILRHARGRQTWRSCGQQTSRDSRPPTQTHQHDLNDCYIPRIYLRSGVAHNVHDRRADVLRVTSHVCVAGVTVLVDGLDSVDTESTRSPDTDTVSRARYPRVDRSTIIDNLIHHCARRWSEIHAVVLHSFLHHLCPSFTVSCLSDHPRDRVALPVRDPTASVSSSALSP